MDTLRYCTNTVHSHTFGALFVRLSHGNISILPTVQTNYFHARNIRIECVLCVHVCVCTCFLINEACSITQGNTTCYWYTIRLMLVHN